MRALKIAGMLAAISAVCVVFLALTTRALEGPFTGTAPGYENSWGAYLGHSTGVGLFIFIGASIGAAVSAWLSRGASRNPYFGPVTTGGFVAVLITAAMWLGSRAEREANMVQYQPPGCEFKVTFPRAPEITPNPVGDRMFEQANVYTKDAVLRAECVPLAAPEAASKAVLRQWLENFAAQQGLTVEHIRVDQLSTGLFGYLVGEKMVSGNKAKYDVRVQSGRKSLLMLMAGSLARAFPPAEAEAFFSSVK